MLLSFSVRNFRCFAEEATLSMTSPALRTNVPRKGQSWADCTERVAAIYGPNAAGKTTFLEAIEALSLAVRTPGHPAVRQPTAGLGDQRPTEFAVDFVHGNVRYVYEVRINSWGVSFEALHAYPRGTRRMLFRRQQESREAPVAFEKGSSLIGPTGEVLRITRPAALFLATAFKYNHAALAPVARALVADLGINFISFRERLDEEVLRRVLMEMLGSPEEHIDLLRALLQTADLGISGIEIRKEELPEDVWMRARRIVDALRDGEESLDEDLFPRLMDVVLFRHLGEDGEEFKLPLAWESAGTITWLTTAWHTLNALRSGSLLLVDELDASLHPELVRYLVTLFLLPHLNPRGAQLVFTTHDVSLLGNTPTRLLEPRNVWFVEKDARGHSDLFSLDDFENRPGNNSERRYLAGQFGAVPDIDDGLLLQYISAAPGEPVLSHG